MSVYLLRMDRAPREGEMFPKQWITLLDLSRAIVRLRLGAQSGRMQTNVKDRQDHGTALRTVYALTSERKTKLK